MLFEQSLRVPAAPAQVWATVTDLAALAECLPGARLESIDAEGRSHGTMTVRVGSMVTSFAGTAWLESSDEAARTADVVAEGAGPQGRAQARIAARVQPDGDGSLLELAISIDITGALARLGQGMAKPVVAQLVEQFGSALSARLAEGVSVAAGGRVPGSAGPPSTAERAAPTAAGADVLDLGSLVQLPPAVRQGLLALLVGLLVLAVARLVRRPAAPTVVICWPPGSPSGPATG